MITSTGNQQVKNLIALVNKSKERRKQNVFIVEGAKMVQEAPAEWVKMVYMSQSYAEQHPKPKGVPTEILSDSVFRAVSDTQTPQGILAVVQQPQYRLEDMLQGRDTLLLLLDQIQDPGNLGTMMRTGEGAGVTGVIMNRTTVDLFNPKTIRSTMGSIYRVPFLVVEDLVETIQTLQQQKVVLYAAHLKGTTCYDQVSYREACGFLIGNEGNGLSDEVADAADVYVKIPMRGQVESLNAAISASLLMYEAGRQRRIQ